MIDVCWDRAILYSSRSVEASAALAISGRAPEHALTLLLALVIAYIGTQSGSSMMTTTHFTPIDTFGFASLAVLALLASANSLNHSYPAAAGLCHQTTVPFVALAVSSLIAVLLKPHHWWIAYCSCIPAALPLSLKLYFWLTKNVKPFYRTKVHPLLLKPHLHWVANSSCFPETLPLLRKLYCWLAGNVELLYRTMVQSVLRFFKQFIVPENESTRV